MLLLGATRISLVIILLLMPSSDPANAPSVLALTPLPNAETSVTEILQKLTTHKETYPYSSQVTSFTAFMKISPIIQSQPLHWSPPNRPISQHLLLRFAHPPTSAQFRLFTALSQQTLQYMPCTSLNPSKFDAFASMTSLVLIPESLQLQMGFSFPFLRAKDLCMSLLIMRTLSLLYVGGKYTRG